MNQQKLKQEMTVSQILRLYGKQFTQIREQSCRIMVGTVKTALL
jgi:hypothetical protein